MKWPEQTSRNHSHNKPNLKAQILDLSQFKINRVNMLQEIKIGPKNKNEYMILPKHLWKGANM